MFNPVGQTVTKDGRQGTIKKKDHPEPGMPFTFTVKWQDGKETNERGSNLKVINNG